MTYDVMGNVTYDNRNGQGYGHNYDAAGRMSSFAINGVIQSEYEYDFRYLKVHTLFRQKPKYAASGQLGRIAGGSLVDIGLVSCGLKESKKGSKGNAVIRDFFPCLGMQGGEAPLPSCVSANRFQASEARPRKLFVTNTQSCNVSHVASMRKNWRLSKRVASRILRQASLNGFGMSGCG